MITNKYIILISKGEWFDKDTEVFDATIYTDRDKPIRMNHDQYQVWVNACESILGLGMRNGDWDEEMCSLDEFDMSYTDKQVAY